MNEDGIMRRMQNHLLRLEADLHGGQFIPVINDPDSNVLADPLVIENIGFGGGGARRAEWGRIDDLRP